MNLGVKIENKGSYILATISGDFDLHEALELFKVISKAASENNVSKILIDYRQMTKHPSYMDELTYAETAAKFWQAFIHSNKDKNPKLAYVGKQLLDSDRTGALVAESRGAFNFQLFQDIGKAVEWLNTDDD